VASYSGSGVSLNAAAGVLTGRLRPHGRLPVAIPAAHGGRRCGMAPGWVTDRGAVPPDALRSEACLTPS
jgi:hypothetical protein